MALAPAVAWTLRNDLYAENGLEGDHLFLSFALDG